MHKQLHSHHQIDRRPEYGTPPLGNSGRHFCQSRTERVDRSTDSPAEAGPAPLHRSTTNSNIGRSSTAPSCWSAVDIEAKTGSGGRSTGLDTVIHRLRADGGQATAEYALVMLAAAGLAGMVLAWAVGGNGVERLMNAVLDSIIAQVAP